MYRELPVPVNLTFCKPPLYPYYWRRTPRMAWWALEALASTNGTFRKEELCLSMWVLKRERGGEPAANPGVGPAREQRTRGGSEGTREWEERRSEEEEGRMGISTCFPKLRLLSSGRAWEREREGDDAEGERNFVVFPGQNWKCGCEVGKSWRSAGTLVSTNF